MRNSCYRLDESHYWQQAENYAIALTDYTENQLAKLPKTSFDR
ncbi:hypothetical protein [Arsenophonus sp. PmNCSU2021_1]